MSYRALLFCPDEKAARTVTQVLAELDFSVETSNEPFAAVKKLTSEHFDALVVDGDNQQNATLLFKTARNSGSNQNSLAVAIVEGQSGVAKAFQIGANLVLTKPINVEQSKGTIRVARGLLRKTEAAKGSSPSASDHGFGAGFGDAKPVSIPPGPAPKPASLTTPPSGSVVTSPTALFETEKEPTPQPEPTEAALLESMHDPIVSKPRTDAMSAPPISKPSSWQPISQPMAQPMATALKHADQAMGKATSTGASAEASIFSHAASGAAAAAAPARERTKIEEEFAFGQKPDLSELVPAHPAKESSRIGLIAAIIVIVVAAGGYFAWTKLRLPLAPVQSHRTSVPPAPATPTTPAQGPVTEPYSAVVSAAPLPHTPATPTEIPSATTKKAITSISVSDANKPAPSPAERDVLVVNSGSPKRPENPEVDAEAVPAPSMVSSGAESTAVSGLVEMPANMPKPAPHTLRISQGVSQGLLVKKVAPAYPQRALSMRIQGAVELLATISKDGNVTDIKLLKGDTMLARAAMDAVKQWKYKPYYLDDKPLEIQTQITVNFKLPY